MYIIENDDQEKPEVVGLSKLGKVFQSQEVKFQNDVFNSLLGLSNTSVLVSRTSYTNQTPSILPSLLLSYFVKSIPSSASAQATAFLSISVTIVPSSPWVIWFNLLMFVYSATSNQLVTVPWKFNWP